MMKLISTFILAVLGSSVLSQNNWLESYGNIVHEEILDAATDASGNIISVGYFSGPTTIGSTSLTSYGSSDILVMKTDNSGAVLWAIKAGGSGPDRAYSVAVDNNGNSYITGYFYNSATFGSINVTGADRDVYAAKIDPNGNFLWAQTFGGQYGDTGYGIEVDNVGNVLVTGQYKGNGVFGSDNFTSTIDPNTGLVAYDFFLTKLDGGGNFLWTREANAKYDDRGLALTIDELNNIYVVGQFSDTITFQNTHNNQSMNAGFLIKYDALGNEIWFDKYRAAQVILYDVKWSDDNLYLTGDFKGNMQVTHQGGTTNFVAGGEYNVLVSKLDEAGNLSWFSSNFSENEVSSKQLALDANNNIYLTGLFKCDFTEMNQLYGNSTFLSLGYRDVHYIKYSNSGTFQWARQFGSNEDDYCSAIVMNGVDHPVMGGSFENWIVIPTGDNFDFSNCASGLTYAGGNCSDMDYGTFCKRKTVGNKDIFLVDPFDISRLPLDYYSHQTACDYDTIAPCILNCEDSVEACAQSSIAVNLHHIVGASDTLVHPRYWYEWNTGSTSPQIGITATGQYTVHTWRRDGCASYHDTIFVTIHPVPASPLITDTWGYNYYASPTEKIDTCYADSLFIYATPGDTLTQTITWNNGVYINDSTRYINQSDYYIATATTTFGCTSNSIIDIVLDDFAQHDTLDPHIHFTNPHQEATDTLYICGDGTWGAFLLDHNYIDVSGGFPYKYSYWFLDGYPIDEMYYWPNINDILNQPPPAAGWHTLSAHLVVDCSDTVDYFIDRDFYVVVVPDPFVNIIGPDVIYGNYCPGDTLSLIVQTSDTTVTWSSLFIVENWTDSVYAVLSMDEQTFSAYVDTITPYVTCSANASYVLPPYDSPEIEIVGIDLHGGIICPGDSLEIAAWSGQAWIWIGPQGDTLGVNQNVWVDLPGFYHCIITDDYGCVLSSNFVEAKEYSSPFLQVEPQLICEGGTTEITVVANQFTSISWLPPLSGSSTAVLVDTAGVYYCETSFCNVTNLDSVIVEISIPLAVIIADPGLIICPGDTVALFANGGMMNYWWNGNPGESIYETATAGTYILQTENEIGCQTTDTVEITYLSNPQPPVVNDMVICLGDDVLLIATAGDSVYWFDLTGQLLGDDDSLFLPNVTADLTLIVKNKDSLCYSLSEDVVITMHGSSVPPVIMSDSVYCENDFVDLETENSTGSFDYTWILPDATTSNNIILSLGEALPAMSGMYSVFYSDTNCVSDTVNINLIINPFPSATISVLTDLQICPGELVTLEATTDATDILWLNGDTSTSLVTDTAGTYFYTAILNGCAANSDTVNVVVSALSASNGPIDTTICEGNSVLLQSNSGSSVIWFDTTMDTLLVASDLLTPVLYSDTIYYFEVTDPGLCPVMEYAVVQVVQTNYVPAVYGATVVCLGDTIALSSDDVGVTDFSWFSVSGELSDSSQLIIPTDVAGTFTYGLVLSFGTCMSDTAFVDVAVNALPLAEVIALSPTIICPGDSVSLLAETNATSVVWIPTGETDTLLVTQMDGFHYYYAELNGCYVVSDMVEISFSETTVFPPISDTVICEGQAVSFFLNTSSDVLWITTDFDTLGTGSSYNTGTLYDDAEYFYQVIDSGLCPTLWQAVFVDVIETYFTPDYTGISDLCMGDSVLITADDLTAQNYFWLVDGDTISTLPFITLQPDGSGNIQVQLVTGSYGCFSDTAFVTISINDLPAFDLPADTVLCMNEELLFITPYDYWIDWYVDNSTGFSEDTFAVVTFTNNAGCYLTDTIQVSYMDCNLFMPNVFTPDGDGVNDQLVFSIEKGEILNLIIQNRWGHVLYEGPAGEWDGVDRSGSEAVAGTYFYIIEYQYFDGSVGKEQGWFFLQR